MRNIFSIARRDFFSSFLTPVAPAAIAAFVFLSGFFFFTLLQQYNGNVSQAAMIKELNPSLNEFVIVPFYLVMQIVLLFLVPVLSMRSFSEERQNSTFELLATSPLSVTEIVWGKALAVFMVLLLSLLLSFIFPLVLVVFADPEVPPLFIGLLGLFLLGSSFAALSIAISACTRSQATAAIVSLVLLLVYYVIDAPVTQMAGNMASVLRYLSPTQHAEWMVKGVLRSSDVVYFLSVIFFGLFLTSRVLDAERWR